MKPTRKPSTEELHEELEQALSRYFHKARRIQKLRRRRSNYSSSYTIENLELELDHGKHLSLIFKDLSPTSLLKTAKEVRPRFLYCPQREMETYGTVLDSERFGTAICYGSIERPDLQRYWLFLERVEGPLLWQVGRIEMWRQAAKWLTRLHSHFLANNGCSDALLPQCLLHYDTNHYMRWVTRAEDFLSRRRASLVEGLYASFRLLADNYDRVVKRLLSMPQTFIHGEFYPANVIIGKSGCNKRICPIDWEVAAVGPGLIDLAALTAGSWNPEQKQLLIKAYRDALEPVRDWPPSLSQLLELVDYCQLHLAVQWLGWSGQWSPPKSHAQDWLREAVGAARRLGVIGC